MNILRFKQRAQGWMAREDGGDSGGTSYSDSDSSGFGPPQSSQNYNNSDASAYGGKESGFDPNSGISSEFMGYNQPSPEQAPNGVVPETPAALPSGNDQFSYLNFLSNMFKSPDMTNNLSQLTQASPAYMAGNPGDEAQQAFKEAHPTMYSWGLRAPGTSAEHMFNTESPTERDTRMGLVSEGLGNVLGAVGQTAMPAPIRLGMGLASAYKNWDSAKPMESAGRALGGLPGYFGAAGQAMQGNYGSALAGGLTKSGASPMTAAGLGMGLDASQGKDVRAPATGLAAYYAGSQLGGPVGGVLGQNLARMYTRKK